MHKKLLVTAYFVIAALLQTMTGNFPLSFFAFPLNVIVAVIWVYLLWRLYKEGNKLPLTRFLLSSRTSILSILLLVGGSLVIGLFPQLSEAEAASISGVPASLGCYNFMTSWIFIAILFLLLSNLAMVVIHAFFGSSDVQTLRIPLYAGQPGREAYSMDGKAYYLDYELELYSFNTEYYPNGMPSHFAADVRIGEQRTTLEVNHPHSYRLGEDIYLTGYDTRNVGNTRYCILQIVRQPWKYVMVTGILMMLAGAVLLFINGPKKAKS